MRTILPKKARLIPENAECVFKGMIFDVYQWPQEMYDGSFHTFEMLKRPDTVGVVAVKDGNIVILKQEQPSFEPFYDIPCGRHDIESETELEAAKRELLEETGMTFKNWRLVYIRQAHTKFDWFIYTYLATDFESQTEQNLDVGEKIEVMEMSFEEVRKLQEGRSPQFLEKGLFDTVDSLEELLALSEFEGIIIS